MPTDRPATTPTGDEGLSLLEVLMAIFIIGTVMAGAAPFMVTSVSLADRQRDDQTAVQIANDAVERVRALQPGALTEGRGKAAAQVQLDTAPAQVKTLLNDTVLAADDKLPDTSTAGQTAALPTKAVEVKRNNTTYSQQWYIGRCWQTKVSATTPVPGPAAAATPNPCSKTNTGVPFLRVVVAVQWPHKACPAQTCLYTASTLVSTDPDLTFDTLQPPPSVTPPAGQFSYVGDRLVNDPAFCSPPVPNTDPVRCGLQVLSTGGHLPLKWELTTVPAGSGLTIDADSGMITGQLAAANSYTVTVTATDKDNRSDDVQFAWTVVNAITVTTPANQSHWSSTAVSLAVPATGGQPSLTWSATGLPPGLTINPTTGVISGQTPVTTQVFTVVVTVTDSGAAPRSKTATFTWTITEDLAIATPAAQSTPPSTTVSLYMSATGGRAPLTWSATGLPTGLTINTSTGVISGRTGSSTQLFKPTVTVRDSSSPARTRSVTFDWSVRAPLTLDSFTPPTADKGTVVNYPLAALAHGGTTPYRWSATNLPDGLSINTSTGTVTGTMLYATQYITTITVTDNAGATATIDVIVQVDTNNGSQLTVTVPSGAALSNPAGSTISPITAQASGSNPPSFRWTAVGLPPGITVTTGGVISGKPTTPGTYRVTLSVTNDKNDVARLMFDWRVT